MPIYGGYKPTADGLTVIKQLAEDRIDIESAQTLTFTFEVPSDPAIAIMPSALHPPFPTYCSLVKSTQYQGWWWTVAERQFNTGVTAHEYCVGYPALRRCYQSDGMVWDEFLDVTSQIWRVSDVVRHSWWG